MTQLDRHSKKLEPGALKKKYKSLARRLPRDFVKRIISGAEAGRKSAMAAGSALPFFAVGTAVLVQTAGECADGGGRGAGGSATEVNGVVRVINGGGESYDVLVAAAAGSSSNGKRHHTRTCAATLVRLRFPLGSSDEDGDVCAICTEPPSIEPVELLCRHEFCAICLDQLVTSSARDAGAKCPLCRQPVAKSDLKAIIRAIKSRPPIDLARERSVKVAMIAAQKNKAVHAKLDAFLASSESWTMAPAARARVLEDFSVQLAFVNEEASNDVTTETAKDAVFSGLQTGEHPHDRMRAIIGAVTNLAINDADLYGDGDQSVVDNTQRGSPGELFKSVWAQGTDFNDWLMQTESGQKELWQKHEFAGHCLTANFEAVSKAIEATEPNSDARYRLLEQRVSMSRLTPLMIAIVGERTLRLVLPDGVPAKSKAERLAESPLSPAYTKVVNILLAGGARSVII